MTELLDMARLFLTLGLALAVVIAAWRFFGLKGAFAALGAIALVLLYRKGRGDGQAEIEKKEAHRAEDVVQEAERARIDARVRDADPERLRVDDGFRRD